MLEKREIILQWQTIHDELSDDFYAKKREGLISPEQEREFEDLHESWQIKCHNDLVDNGHPGLWFDEDIAEGKTPIGNPHAEVKPNSVQNKRPPKSS